MFCEHSFTIISSHTWGCCSDSEGWLDGDETGVNFLGAGFGAELEWLEFAGEDEEYVWLWFSLLESHDSADGELVIDLENPKIFTPFSELAAEDGVVFELVRISRSATILTNLSRPVRTATALSWVADVISAPLICNAHKHNVGYLFQDLLVIVIFGGDSWVLFRTDEGT